MVDSQIIQAATVTASSLKDNVVGALSDNIGFLVIVGVIIIVGSLVLGIASVFLEGKYGRRIF